MCRKGKSTLCWIKSNYYFTMKECSTVQRNKVLVACASILMYFLYLINIFL